ncbi:TadE/TadG family type IV pilus assembly protein [Pararhizobium haloflavum]|uniref:TadE/TadG family type IV pilus assembly protein n=1 Tax=Pararhizobium haloflavum TaxID=2037914 RepID=UPI0012FFF71A|nr:TadE/TadG family type IV pilus assembly protein [Pararhizobium haloflavum]
MRETRKTPGGILSRLWRDRRGVGAIEFAFIAPVMIVLYIGAVEMSVAMSVNKKLARATSTVGDLITQRSTLEKSDLPPMVNVAQSIMAPYDVDPIQLKLTGIAVDEDGEATIDWSWMPDNEGGRRAYENGDEVEIPDSLRIAGAFYVRSEIAYRHDMITSFPITGKTMTAIDMGKTYHLRPRLGSDLPCDGC